VVKSESNLSIIIELISGLIFLFIIIQFLGKSHFSQLTPFDFISALILGELVGNAIFDDKTKIYHIAVATLTWGILIYSLEKITQKFKRARKLLEGDPNIVIHKGKIKYEVLKKINLDLNQLKSLIRQQGYFSIQEVEYAIMETNGTISVLPKSESTIPKRNELNLPSQPVQLPITIIMDGEIVYNNLKEAGLDENWLIDQLAMQNISNYQHVLYAEWSESNPLKVYTY
jgi:uncharacterized membrane protein YcaP (DUF421 family)